MKHDIIKQEENIIQEVKRYSKRFIEKMGGFYPFAIGMNDKNEIFSIGAYEGNEFPKSQDLINLLEKSINTEISNRHIILAAICIDIFLYQTVERVKFKKNAIEIRFMSASGNKIEHLIYELSVNNSVEFIELES